jgi:hypothetical protein
MKRHIPGLHHENRSSEGMLEGVFLVRVDRAFYRWHPQRPFFVVRFAILDPRALWKLNWFLRDFCYDPDLMGRDEVDEKALAGLLGIVRVSHTVLNGHSFLNLDAFAPAADWETAPVCEASGQEIHRDI